MKKVIVNDLARSSWRFERFDSLSVIADAADTNLSLALH